MSGAVVTGLFFYPVKSCAGTELDVAELDRRGIVFDREFMLVDERGEFLTQREFAHMALIRPRRTAEFLELSAPGIQSIVIEPRGSGGTQTVRIWRDHVEAVDQGELVADWLSTFLDARVRLVRQADGAIRRVDPAFAIHPDNEVAFPDGYPLLLISEESLADLNSRLAEAVPMSRFRPNVVIRGADAAFAEDGWQRVSVGEVECSLVKACARCTIPTVNQVTAERGTEPLATLTQFRHVPRGVLFGQNLIHHTRGTLRVGDAVQVLERRAVPELVH